MYCIYKLSYPEINFLYIGSTQKTLEERFKLHIRDYFSDTQKKLCYYLILKDKITAKWEFYQYIKIELICYATNNSYNYIEGYFQQKYNCCNKRQEGVDRIKNDKVYTKKWREKNKESIKADQRKRYLKDKNNRLKKQSNYHNKNKNKINEIIQCDNCNMYLYKRGLKRHYNSPYCKKYKATIKLKTKYECECGYVLTKNYNSAINSHLKSKLHERQLNYKK